MKRAQLFQHLIDKFGYQSYLEIGCETDKTFGRVDLPRKVGVDPRRGGTHRMTSDEFFAQAQNGETFDLVFVDGLHRREQVLRDVENTARCLSPGGCIVLHDCLPTEREQQLSEPVRPGAPWTGDVWKAVVDLGQRAEFDLAVLDADWGLGVLFVRPNSDRLEPQRELEWEDYVAGRERLLRIVDEEGIKRFIKGERVVAKRSRSQIGSLTPALSQGERGITGSALLHANVGHEVTGLRGRPTIVFAHGALGQFEPLHRFLNESGLADSYLFCTEGNHRVNQSRVPKLLPYKPHGGKLSEPQSFYHLGRVEAANRRSLGLRKALLEFQKRQRIDLLVAHVTMGSPSLLFDEFDFPIVSYVEFPSFRHHGWDARYPPTEGQQLRDKNFEMLATHCVLKSDRTLVPSEYARSMFPTELRPRISALMEGFPMHSEGWSRNGVLPKEPGVQYVGFAARDLSSAKGFQQFVRIANRVAEQRPHVRFVVLGSDKTPYSYELKLSGF